MNKEQFHTSSVDLIRVKILQHHFMSYPDVVIACIT